MVRRLSASYVQNVCFAEAFAFGTRLYVYVHDHNQWYIGTEADLEPRVDLERMLSVQETSVPEQVRNALGTMATD